jgi:hypothetical protein
MSGLSISRHEKPTSGARAPSRIDPEEPITGVTDMQTIDTQKLMNISPWKAENALASDDPGLAPFLTFTNKDEYLEWRQEWKREYRELSQYIRECKKAFRAEGNNHDVKTVSNLYANKALARTMLALRKGSKARAEELYQQSKATAEVA